MASYDSADLLSRCKRLADVPDVDEGFDDTDWYALLTDAQHYYYGEFATHVPHVLMSAPTLLTTSDGGYTYALPSSLVPLHLEIYDSATGRLLKHGAYWDSNADYTLEGTKIRRPRGGTHTYSSGPYIRYIATPSDIASGTEPTLVPVPARQLLVWHACGDWARRPGSLVSYETFQDAEDRLWLKTMTNLKTADNFLGAAAIATSTGVSFANLNTCDGGYTAI
jgi:hypothetical protein